jgi:hypothetical protein
MCRYDISGKANDQRCNVDSDSRCRRHSGTIWLTYEYKVLYLISFWCDPSERSLRGIDWLHFGLCSVSMGPYSSAFFATHKFLILKPFPFLMQEVIGMGSTRISGRYRVLIYYIASLLTQLICISLLLNMAAYIKRELVT